MQALASSAIMAAAISSKNELVAAQADDQHPRSFEGQAGATGFPQFMPLALRLRHDGDGWRNIWSDELDGLVDSQPFARVVPNVNG